MDFAAIKSLVVWATIIGFGFALGAAIYQFVIAVVFYIVGAVVGALKFSATLPGEEEKTSETK